MDIVSAVVLSIQKDCSCNFTETNIPNFEFSCRTIENTVVFRAEIVYTAFGEDPYTADGLVTLVSTWAQSGTSISVDSTRLDVDPSCPTQLESFQAGDCETTGGTSVAALGGAVGAVCVLLIVIGIIIVVVILVQNRNSSGNGMTVVSCRYSYPSSSCKFFLITTFTLTSFCSLQS